MDKESEIAFQFYSLEYSRPSTVSSGHPPPRPSTISSDHVSEEQQQYSSASTDGQRSA
eukprot:c45150_g1_i1 orf=54-227(-)